MVSTKEMGIKITAESCIKNFDLPFTYYLNIQTLV